MAVSSMSLGVPPSRTLTLKVTRSYCAAGLPDEIFLAASAALISLSSRPHVLSSFVMLIPVASARTATSIARIK
jgi:hypothetical protein